MLTHSKKSVCIKLKSLKILRENDLHVCVSLWLKWGKKKRKKKAEMKLVFTQNFKWLWLFLHKHFLECRLLLDAHCMAYLNVQYSFQNNSCAQRRIYQIDVHRCVGCRETQNQSIECQISVWQFLLFFFFVYIYGHIGPAGVIVTGTELITVHRVWHWYLNIRFNTMEPYFPICKIWMWLTVVGFFLLLAW